MSDKTPPSEFEKVMADLKIRQLVATIYSRISDIEIAIENPDHNDNSDPATAKQELMGKLKEIRAGVKTLGNIIHEKDEEIAKGRTQSSSRKIRSSRRQKQLSWIRTERSRRKTPSLRSRRRHSVTITKRLPSVGPQLHALSLIEMGGTASWAVLNDHSWY